MVMHSALFSLVTQAYAQTTNAGAVTLLASFVVIIETNKRNTTGSAYVACVCTCVDSKKQALPSLFLEHKSVLLVNLKLA